MKKVFRLLVIIMVISCLMSAVGCTVTNNDADSTSAVSNIIEHNNLKSVEIENLNDENNSKVIINLPEGWCAKERIFEKAPSFEYNAEKNKHIKKISSFEIYNSAKADKYNLYGNEGLAGEFYVQSYYRDQPESTRFPNHCSVKSREYSGETALGQGEVFILDFDILPKEMRTEEYSTFDMIYVWIPIEGEMLAYNLSISVPLGEKEDEYIDMVKKMLNINTSDEESVYDVSEDKRGMLLAEKLHINYDKVKEVGQTVNDNGITMSVLSSYTNGIEGVVLLSFTKDSGEVFYNSMNPGVGEPYPQAASQKKVNSSIITELSKDEKTLYCYMSILSATSLNNETVAFNIANLYCNQSQVEGVTFKDEIIYGNWSSEVVLDGNDETIKADNTKLSKTVSMCGKKLQIDSVTIANRAVVFNTTVLKDEGLPKGMDVMLSSISATSGAYYDVFVRLLYEDGTTSEKADCFLDDKGNIIAWFFDPIDTKALKAVKAGDVTVEFQHTKQTL